MKNWLKLLISILVTGLAGFIGSFFTTSSVMTWYPSLIKPSFNPPAWVFGPVWSILYIMIGVSLFLVWTTNKVSKKKAYFVFGVQLVLNALWSIVFFGMQRPALAFLVIVLLWLSIIVNIIEFYKIKKSAGYILFPYLVWVSFAAVLNLFIWVLNG